MADQRTDGPHEHDPCLSCGVVEGEIDGLCAECAARKGADEEVT